MPCQSPTQRWTLTLMSCFETRSRYLHGQPFEKELHRGATTTAIHACFPRYTKKGSRDALPTLENLAPLMTDHPDLACFIGCYATWTQTHAGSKDDLVNGSVPGARFIAQSLHSET